MKIQLEKSTVGNPRKNILNPSCLQVSLKAGQRLFGPSYDAFYILVAITLKACAGKKISKGLIFDIKKGR